MFELWSANYIIPDNVFPDWKNLTPYDDDIPIVRLFLTFKQIVMTFVTFQEISTNQGLRQSVNLQPGLTDQPTLDWTK